jgi:heme-degrading monooxygenase HmoA
MFATIRVYSGNTDLADALVENESEVKRIISEIDGFQSYYLVRTADGAASMSVYEDEDGAAASDRAAAAWVGENLPELKVAAPQTSAGDVISHF